MAGVGGDNTGQKTPGRPHLFLSNKFGARNGVNKVITG